MTRHSRAQISLESSFKYVMHRMGCVPPCLIFSPEKCYKLSIHQTDPCAILPCMMMRFVSVTFPPKYPTQFTMLSIPLRQQGTKKLIASKTRRGVGDLPCPKMHLSSRDKFRASPVPILGHNALGMRKTSIG